jgi:hypothetical protein
MPRVGHTGRGAVQSDQASLQILNLHSRESVTSSHPKILEKVEAFPSEAQIMSFPYIYVATETSSKFLFGAIHGSSDEVRDSRVS